MSPRRWTALGSLWPPAALNCPRGGGVTPLPAGHTRCSSCSSGESWPTGPGSPGTLLNRFDIVNLIRDVSEDDAFYYFQIARNLAEGKFSTFDGCITRTNGYHPLWLFLITPFYWVFDKETALFGIKAFEIMLVAGGVALVTAAARLARMPWYLMFAALPMLYQHRALNRRNGSGGSAVHVGPVHSDLLPLRAKPGAVEVAGWPQ